MSKTGQCGLNPSESRSLRSLKIACKALQNSRVTNRMVLFCFYAFSMSHGRSPIARPCTLSNYWWWSTILRDVTDRWLVFGHARPFFNWHGRAYPGSGLVIESAWGCNQSHGGATSRTGVRSRDFVALLIALGVQRRAEPCCRIRTGVPPVARGCNAKLSLIVASARGCPQLHGGATCPGQNFPQNVRSSFVSPGKSSFSLSSCLVCCFRPVNKSIHD